MLDEMNPARGQNPVISINSNCGNIIDSYKTVWNNCEISVADEKRAILEWLSPLEPRERNQAIGMDRVPEVGDWLLDTNEFTQWNQGGDGTTNPVLFCYGDPGVGKTYLISLVIDRLCDQVEVGNTAVACFYCDFYSPYELSPTGLLGALLKQVVSALEPIPDEVKKAFENSRGGIGGRKLLLHEILPMLLKCLSRLRRVFICIDALDEFPEKHRLELWESLQQIMQMCPNTRLFLTGRLHIREEAKKHFPKAEKLSIITRASDIALYLRMRLDRDSELEAQDKELEADILKIIPEVTSGTFLLVSLNMNAILEEATIYQRRQALHKMTKGLGLQDAYDKTLDRIKRQSESKSRLGMEALMWISHCERPLKAKELCHALGVEVGAEDFSTENVLSIRPVLGYTLGLVKIDELASTPRLLHSTLQEYLRNHPTLFVTAHSMMAEICLTYLNTRLVRVLSPVVQNVLQAAPFLEYATCFWGDHAAKGVTKPVKSLALRLLDGYENHASSTVLWRRRIREWWSREDILGISGLHCIAFWGIAEIAIAMLEMKMWRVNGCDSEGKTPLMWAVEYKKRGMMELFLGQEDIEPDKVIKDGRTVFSFATELGDEDAVKLLLERGGVNPNSTNSNDRTPLSFAAEGGKEGIMKLLLKRGDIDPNFADCNGRTPLSFAAGEGQGGVVKLLLEQEDIDPDSADSHGRTPLSFAAERGQEGVVWLLSQRGDVNPGSADSNGRTPVSIAAEKGQEGVVKLLLEREDINPDLTDSHGRTPLSFAAERGQEGVVRLLLGRGDVDPNSPDGGGRTPLSFAAEGGLEGVVKLLLQRGDINPNLLDFNGLTPLSFAADRGQESVVKLLLEWVNPNSPDGNGRTPLSIATEREQEGVVKLLLERDDVDPNLPDGNGRTPLSIAIEKKQEGVVELLLERDDINPNSPDGNGRTPLIIAAEGGHGYLVERLLKRKNINPNLPDSNSRTPLLYAVIARATSVVELLLQRADVDPNLAGNDCGTPLFSAAWRRYVDLVSLLLDRSDIEPDLRDGNGRTLLSFVAEWGREDIVKLLLERGDVNPDLPDSNGRKPLSYAIMNGRESIARLLSNSTTLNCESSEDNDRMPTSIADENASCNEATHQPQAARPAGLYTPDGPAPETPISVSVLYEPPIERAPRLLQFSPEQLLSPPATFTPLPPPSPGSVFHFFICILIPLIFLSFALMMCNGYGDSDYFMPSTPLGGGRYFNVG